MNGKEAVEWGKKAVPQIKAWYPVGALAAAYARNREFDKAVKGAEKSIGLLRKEDKKTQEKYLKGALERLNLYKKRQPYTSE